MKTIALQDLDERVRAFVVGLHEGDVVNIVDGSRPFARLERPAIGVHTPALSDEERQRRHLAFVDLLKKQPALHLGRFNRGELYEQD
jgi:hypothetical protein